jgi:hypothetical protein
MGFTIMLVCSGDRILLVDIKNETVYSFFKNEKTMFQGSLSELTPVVQKKIEDNFNIEHREFKVAHVFKVVALAGEKKCPYILTFIKKI